MGKVGKGLRSDGNPWASSSFPMIYHLSNTLTLFPWFSTFDTQRWRDNFWIHLAHTCVDDHICDRASKTQDRLMSTALYSLQSTSIDMISPDTYNSFFNSCMTGEEVSRSHSYAANLSIIPLHVEAWMLVQALAHTCVHAIP